MQSAQGGVSPGIVKSGFIYEQAPFPSAHASTIVEAKEGLVAAWFGGTAEGAEDVGIWLSRHEKGTWSSPVEVATGVQADGRRYPCWNPVLFQMPDGELALFYKVGPSPRRWWGMVLTSRDAGRSWGEPKRLPDGILGPIKNKPVRFADGTIISPSSTETDEKPSTWRIHFERSTDGGRTWTVVRPPAAEEAPADPPAGRAAPEGARAGIDAIQPSILVHGPGRLQALGRTRSGRIFETWSEDGGRSWSPMLLTMLPNPSAGTDAQTLQDGRHLLVYNHTPRGRTPLNVAVSKDGKAWAAAAVLESEPGEYSYPFVIQASDGVVHITYTWRRLRIKHAVIDPKALKTAPIVNGAWP